MDTLNSSQLPEVDQSSLISRDLQTFRQIWSPSNPATGDAKWNEVLAQLDRVIEGINQVKQTGDGWDVELCIIAARNEVNLALSYAKMRPAKEYLELFLEEYTVSENLV